MPIWDAVALGLAGSGTNPELNGVPLINNSYNCYVGSVLAFYIGEGRVTAIYGGETKLVFDWESVFLNFWKGEKDDPTSLLGKTRRLMGGGDTTLVLGPTNKLNYYGSDLAVNRARDEFKMTWETSVLSPDGQPDKTKTASIPRVIQFILALGFFGILATALVLRYWWGFYGISSSKPQTEQEELASVLIPMFEGLWLSLLYAVEAVEGGLAGLGKGVLDSLKYFVGMMVSGAATLANAAVYPFVQLGQFLYSGVENVANLLSQSMENASANTDSVVRQSDEDGDDLLSFVTAREGNDSPK